MTPIELPIIASGTIPCSSRNLSAPTWCAPSAAPPPRMKTRFCRLAMGGRPSHRSAGGELAMPARLAIGRARAPMLMLVDYSSLLFRTFHTIPESVPMHAVYGFLNMLARLIADRRPGRLGIAVDEDWRPAFRVDALPSYKTHRVSDEPDPIAPQEALGREVLAAIGIAVAGAEGFEAEDVIATLAARARGSRSCRATATCSPWCVIPRCACSIRSPASPSCSTSTRPRSRAATASPGAPTETSRCCAAIRRT